MLSVSLSQAIFAHRGASAHAPENTLAAFRLALESQADGIELDTHLSADDQIMVIHDGNVSRTTNGQGKVYNLKFEELRKLDAGNGETIPTLAEVFDLIGSKLYINIELKGFSSSAAMLPQKVTKLVHERNLDQKIIYSSFNPLLLINTRKHSPQAKLGLLMLPGGFGTAIRLIFSPFVRPWSLNPHFSSVSPKFFQRAKQHNRSVITYTVNQADEMRRLFALGINGIITDDPELALEVRETK
jgi:glycerophosphoryl diester phosphodiesterase